MPPITQNRAENGRWLWTLVVAAVLTQGGLNLLRPVTSYKLLAFGADSWAVGLSTAAYAVIPLAVAVWAGHLSDRMLKLRYLLGAGALILALGGVGLALANSILTVAAASAVLGFGHLLFTIAGQSAVARYSTPDRLDAGFGWFTAAYSVGQLVGPLAGGWLLGGTDSSGDARMDAVVRALWIGAGVAALAAPLFLFRLPGSPRDHREDPLPGQPWPEVAPNAHADGGPDVAAANPAEIDDAAANRAEIDEAAAVPSEIDAATADAGSGQSTSPPHEEGKPTIAAILRRPHVGANMLAALALLSMLDILTAFLPVVGENLGVSPAVIGTLLALRAAASIVCRAGLPAMVRRIGRRPLMLWCLFGAGASLALPPLALAAWPGTVGIVVAGVLLVIGGFFLGLGQPLTMTAITQAVPGSWRGSALAVRLMGNRLGQVGMPLAAGAVASGFGAGGAIWMTCLLLVVAGGVSAVDGRERG